MTPSLTDTALLDLSDDTCSVHIASQFSDVYECWLTECYMKESCSFYVPQVLINMYCNDCASSDPCPATDVLVGYKCVPPSECYM